MSFDRTERKGKVMKGERIFLGACVNYAGDELKKATPGFHVKILVVWLRGLSARIRNGSVAKSGSQVVFMDILQVRIGSRHFNLSNDTDASAIADVLDGRIGELESAGDRASVGAFLDALCDAANKAYDRGCPLLIDP